MLNQEIVRRIFSQRRMGGQIKQAIATEKQKSHDEKILCNKEWGLSTKQEEDDAVTLWLFENGSMQLMHTTPPAMEWKTVAFAIFQSIVWSRYSEMN